jgi:hypothetical protein
MPHVGIPMCFSHSLATYWGLQATAEEGALTWTWRLPWALAAIYLNVVLIRIYDELKDADHDIERAREGDQEYVNRPLVTGEVRIEDIAALRWWVVGLSFLLAFPVGKVFFIAYAFAFFYCWLSFKWFFSTAVQNNRLLAFVSHLPVYYFSINFCMTALFVVEFGWDQLSANGHLLVLALWLSNGVWDLMRKTRLPEEETGFQSYSKLIGWRRATILPILFIGATALCMGSGPLSAIGLPLYSWVFYGVSALAAGACVLLLMRPTVWLRSRFRTIAELYLLVFWLGLTAAMLAQRGLVSQ